MDYFFEREFLAKGYRYAIGCDDVGRGSLAGPVVAAAAVFDLEMFASKVQPEIFSRVDDSKVVTSLVRELVNGEIKEFLIGHALGVVSHTMIDRYNIHRASLCAMRQAVGKIIHGGVSHEAIYPREAIVFVDGRHEIPGLSFSQRAIVDGDAKIFSVAVASIVAKVFRDRLMEKLHEEFPVYNFAQHKGYGTREHGEMIREHGLSEVHRRTFCGKWL